MASRSRLCWTVLLVTLLSLTGCALPGFDSGAEEAAERLAAALARNSLEGVAISGDAATARKQYAAIVADTRRPEVQVRDLDEDGDRATVRLDWRRPVAAETWSYRTTAQLVRSADSWRLRWEPRIVEPSLRTGEVLATSAVKAERGRILAGDGTAIVKPRPVLRVGLDKTGLSAKQALASGVRLAELVGVDARSFGKQVRAAGERAFVQAIVFRRAEAPQEVLAELTGVRGARAISDRLPLAPTREFGSGLLGTVGPATAEVVEESKGRVRAGDEVGLSGLQKRYDDQLFGTPGETVAAVLDGGSRRTLFSAQPVPGKDLATTLDIDLQRLAERLLGDVRPASALVALKPSTGELLAVANGSGSKDYPTATFGRYAPGSTFKIVSTLALLRAGLDPKTQVDCPASTSVDGKRFSNYSDYPASALGRIPLVDAVVNSCNTAFVGQHDRLTPEALSAAAAALGLGVDHDLGFPAYFGQVGEPSSATQLAASMIGQGTVLASPMVMAAVLASVLHGQAVIPELLPDRQVANQDPDRPLTAREAAQLRRMLREVVERGSGTVLQGLPDGPVLAKTGTAEFGDEPPLPTHAWMVGGQGDLAVAVFVERGDSGSGTAGPILRSFLEGARG